MTLSQKNKSVLTGVLLVLAGLAYFYSSTYPHFLQIRAGHNEERFHHILSVAFGPIFVVTGLFYLIRRPERLSPWKLSTRDGMIYWAAIFLTLIVSIEWFESAMK